jgi:ArsR family metal-binding transcriptional regulator
MDVNKIIEEEFTLLENLSENEILALLYFKFPEFAKYSEKLDKITKKRRELAISLYKKGKISIEAASEIAGVSIKEFMEMLKNKKLSRSLF